MAYKTFDDYMEPSIRELITADFQPALLNKKLLQQCVTEPEVKTVFNCQLHVALASPTMTETLTTVFADLARTYNGADFVSTMMTRKSVPAHLRTDC